MDWDQLWPRWSITVAEMGWKTQEMWVHFENQHTKEHDH